MNRDNERGGGRTPAAGFDDLLRRARAGDEGALNALLAELRPYLKAVAARSFDRKLSGRHDASDLVQDALAEGVRDFERFDGANEAQLRSWFRRILQANSIDLVRAQLGAMRRSAGAERSLDDTEAGGGLRDRLAAEATSPSQMVARSQTVAQLLDAMNALPEAQREALRLWQSGHSAREIGARLGRTETAAASLVKHALKALREQFPQADDSGGQDED